MDCSNCNEKLSEKNNFCPNCGTKVIQDIVPKDKGNNSLPNIKPIYVIIFAGILAILAVLLILDSNAPEQKNTEINNQSNQEISQQFSKIEALEKKVANDPENIDLNIELGNNLFDAKQYQKAIPHYRKGLEANLANIEVRIDLAVSYYNLQIVDTALVEIEKALKLNPHHQQGLYNLGVMYYNSGNKEKAKESWNTLIELHDGSQAAETAKQLLQNI